MFGSVGCVGFLVEGTCACVLMDEARSCLSGGQDRVFLFISVSSKVEFFRPDV